MSDSVPGGSGSGQDTTGSESEVDILNQDTDTSSDEDTVVSDEGDEKAESEEGEAEAESEEEEAEEEPDEEEVEEETEEELTEGEEPTRPSWQLIKEKYPELAKNKDFRELYFRDKAYTEVFPTVADAKEAFDKSEQLDAVDATLVNGDVDTIFATLKPEVLDRIADRILPALYKSSQPAFARAARPLLTSVLNLVLNKANAEGDDNLRKSVRNISRALTGNPDLPSITQVHDPQIEAERNRLQEERNGLFLSQQRNFLGNCDRSVIRKLNDIAADGIDPKGQFTNFTRNAILEKTMNDVQNALLSDTKLRGRLQQMHKLAARSGFPDEYRARIVSATLERAKQLVPMFRDKHRRAALGRQSSGGNNKEKIVTKNETVTSGGRTSRGKIDMKRTSAEDFLNDRVTFRK